MTTFADDFDVGNWRFRQRMTYGVLFRGENLVSDIPHIKSPRQPHPGAHKPHHSDHSGAHHRGTHEHMQNAENPMHGMPEDPGAMAEGSPAEEASESPQEEAAEQSAGMGGAAGPGGTEGSPV